MECRWPQEIHLDVVWRQVIARGQPRLVELHGPVGGGEQPAAQPDFHMSDGRDDADLVAWRHDEFNGSGDTTIPFVEGIWLMPADLEQFADGNGAPRRLKKGVDDEARYLPFCKFWPRVGNAVVVLHAVANRTIDPYSIAFFAGRRMEIPREGDYSDPVYGGTPSEWGARTYLASAAAATISRSCPQR
jgi:hypothetical protein